MKSGHSASHTQETKCSPFSGHGNLGLNDQNHGTLKDVLQPKHSAPTWGLPEAGLSRGLNPGASAMSTPRDGSPSPEEPLGQATGPRKTLYRIAEESVSGI